VAETDPASAYLLDIFWRLSSLRTQGFNGPDPLQPVAIEAWCRLTCTALSLDEIAILFKMDAAFIAACQRESAEQQPGEGGS
jgi:hypothetical protein